MEGRELANHLRAECDLRITQSKTAISDGLNSLYSKGYRNALEDVKLFLDEFEAKTLVPLSGEILAKSGWTFAAGIYVLRSTPRLGWKPKSKILIVGYNEWPKQIKTVFELEQMLGLLGIDNQLTL